MTRRIAIYLDSGSTIPATKIQLNHLYTGKLELIMAITGERKATIARMLLMRAFEAKDNSELKDKINYAASLYTFTKINEGKSTKGIGSKVGHVCKKALKLAIDRGYLL